MYNKLKILIVEDEPLIAEAIKTNLSGLNLNEIHIEYGLNEAIAQLKVNNFDLILVDIRMKGLYDGIELGTLLTEKEIRFIYITAHSDLEMIKKMASTKATAFVSKPIRKEDLLLNVTFALNSILEKDKEVITVRSGYDFVPFKKKNFLYLKTDGNYLELYLVNNDKILVRTSIERFLEDIGDSDFIQIHRSYVINLSKVKLLKSDSVTLISGENLPVSRTHLSSLRATLSKKGY